MSKKLTTEEFIERAIIVHGDKYGYDDVEYTGRLYKVKIFCKDHKVYFEQVAKEHLLGRGCKMCLWESISSNDNEFVEKANKIHKNLYDYSNVKYVNAKTKVEIICKEHGSFFQIPNSHLRGAGCPHCNKLNNVNRNAIKFSDFVKRAINVHGYKYEYEEDTFINGETKMSIFCPTHNVRFQQTPTGHLVGKSGCRLCSTEKFIASNTKSTEDFIKQAKIKHKNKYSYEKTVYKNSKTSLIVTCNIHGDFEILPSTHLSGSGCRKCSIENKVIVVKEEDKVKNTRSDLLNYFTSEEYSSMYRYSKKIIESKCPLCGFTEKLPMLRLVSRLHPCKRCSSGGVITEKLFLNILDLVGESYSYQYMPDWSENKRYDFYLPNHNCIIEIHGLQHYKDVSGWDSKYEDVKNNDIYKKNLAIKNGINLYIEIDARLSSYNWLKDNYIKGMKGIFEISNEVFSKAFEYSQKSIMYKILELWKIGMSIKDLSNELGVSKQLVSRHLIASKSIGISNYGTPKKILQYDLNLNLIKIWDSHSEARKSTGINTILEVCNLKNKTARGFIWKFEGDEDFSFNTKPKERKTYTKKIVMKTIFQYDSSLNLIKEHNSMVEATEYSGVRPNYINRCLSKHRKSSGGFIWSCEPLHEVNEEEDYNDKI